MRAASISMANEYINKIFVHQRQLYPKKEIKLFALGTRLSKIIDFTMHREEDVNDYYIDEYKHLQ